MKDTKLLDKEIDAIKYQRDLERGEEAKHRQQLGCKISDLRKENEELRKLENYRDFTEHLMQLTEDHMTISSHDITELLEQYEVIPDKKALVGKEDQ